AIEAALPTAPALAAEIASFRDAAAQMAMLTRVTPSVASCDRLLERIQLDRIRRERADAPAGHARGGRLWRGTGLQYLAAAAVILALGALSAESIESARRADATDAARVALAARLQRREKTLDTIFHAEKDLRLIHLRAADTVNGPGIQFFWNEKN